MLSYLRPADRTLTAKRSNIEQMTRLRSQTDLCLLAEWQGVCVNSVSRGSDEMALTRVALFSLHAKTEAIWRGLVVLFLMRGVNTGWQHRTVDVVTIAEERGLRGTNSRRNTTPSTWFHPHSRVSTVNGKRFTWAGQHVSGTTPEWTDMIWLGLSLRLISVNSTMLTVGGSYVMFHPRASSLTIRISVVCTDSRFLLHAHSPSLTLVLLTWLRCHGSVTTFGIP